VNRTGRYGKLFFDLDPLVLLSSWVAGHEIASGLLLSLIVAGVTFFAGRWFCGWVCPFGALHNLLTSIRRTRAKARIAAGGYSPWQRTRYYVLIVFLGAAFLGLNLAGWLDPFSLLFRSFAVVLFPVFHDGAAALATWIYQHDPHLGALHLTALSEPLYESLRRNVLASTQPHYYGALGIAAVFFAAVCLNLFRPRFWCRYVCPLGALLGFLGKNPLLRLDRDPDACNNCGLCVADCQGGANPGAVDGWKPAECFYCWNCHSACPKRALSFTAGGRAKP
jgi:polyferredoxin